MRPLLRIARFLPASWLVQRSLVEGTSKSRCGSTATSRFGKLICDPTFCLLCLPMFHRSLQGWFPRYGSLCVRSSWRRRVAQSVPCSRFIVGICINFLVASVPTLVSLVSSVRSLSALFSSSRFPTSLVSFGYLVFCLLFLPLACVLFVCLSPHCAVGIGS